jgi:hypothetical protein
MLLREHIDVKAQFCMFDDLGRQVIDHFRIIGLLADGDQTVPRFATCKSTFCLGLHSIIWRLKEKIGTT